MKSLNFITYVINISDFNISITCFGFRGLYTKGHSKAFFCHFLALITSRGKLCDQKDLEKAFLQEIRQPFQANI